MHLKTLTMKGFKSFASSTTLRLEPGITAVVGPNGSGKSNVVDALTWVMGEQGAKNLRGGSMADVIFAGAGSRPALGRAEVSLTIDNTDGSLPIDYTEVTITRTLFRGGGSEYRINGTACRLLDVQELLSDTGLGRQMHVIVGQGRLDAVLSATPDDRRGFIEEAAGVLKHRRRRERALRKLDTMAADLARLTDLTTELRRQLGPLARQAAIARRARTIQIEVRDATARLLADDVVQAQALLQAGDEDKELLDRRRAAVEEADRAARARLAELAAVEAASAQRLTRATGTWEELTGAARSLSSLADVAAERMRGLASASLPARGTDPDELERRAEEAAVEETGLADAARAARSALARATSERADAEDAEDAAERELSRLQRQAADRRESLARAGGRVASARSRHEAALAALAQARSALTAAEERERAARSALDEHRGAGAEPRADAGPDDSPDSFDDRQVRAVAAHESATAALAVARDAVAAATDARREAASNRATWTARRDTLAQSLAAKDATATLAGADLPGVLGPLSEAVSVERGWENAVASLLGELAGAVLVTGTDAAAGAIAHVRDEDGGALRLVLLQDPDPDADRDRDQDSGTTPPAPDDPPTEGVREAVGLVSADRAGLAASLARILTGAWVAADLRAAQAVREAVPDAVVATRDGDVLAPAWATSAGRGTSSVLELAAAHEEAAERADAAAAAERQADISLQRARDREEEARRGAGRALATLRAADAEAARVAEEAATLASAARAAREETGRARRVLERTEDEAARRTTELASATSALAQIESGWADGGDGGLDAAVEAAQERRGAAVAAARRRRADETEARLTLRTAEERERSGRGRADSLRDAARRERRTRDAVERAEARRTAQLVVARHVHDQARAAARAAHAWVEQARGERESIEAERAEAGVATGEIRDELDELTAERTRLTDAAHRDEIARAEQHTRLQALAERAMNELGLELEPLVDEFGPHVPVPDVPDEIGNAVEAGRGGEAGRAAGGEEQDEPAAIGLVPGRPYVRAEQEKRLARASRDLTRLGRVNPLALEEHAAMEQRHQFLAEQLADLKSSRADLLRIVEEIDTRVQEVFSQAFEDTARQFASVFDRLFPGGEGRLVLTDPGDMLTTGVEIEARPAGKRVKRLSLLSGGERSLAAVALLVAIFKARPSPFYVLDEVEAALDDTNLGRLLEIFAELRESSQLIIVTHQKRTMEVADALYGISMREGVTKAVSQRLARPQGARSREQTASDDRPGPSADHL
ncbi:chromosome segregation protein SMC [uncultured Actinomyces sp.]|uniref:chromosome segregation protein SMC n=3 Tax=Actinomyces TaxID=1654 RepID=UPI0028EA9828|nr:chromosome segregation protein SMC [uncultured Actinomyces sp.]